MAAKAKAKKKTRQGWRPKVLKRAGRGASVSPTPPAFLELAPEALDRISRAKADRVEALGKFNERALHSIARVYDELAQSRSAVEGRFYKALSDELSRGGIPVGPTDQLYLRPPKDPRDPTRLEVHAHAKGGAPNG